MTADFNASEILFCNNWLVSSRSCARALHKNNTETYNAVYPKRRNCRKNQVYVVAPAGLVRSIATIPTTRSSQSLALVKIPQSAGKKICHQFVERWNNDVLMIWPTSEPRGSAPIVLVLTIGRIACWTGPKNRWPEVESLAGILNKFAQTKNLPRSLLVR